MNKLITFLSPYKGAAAKITDYKIDGKIITGSMTNEPVMKYLSDKLVAEGGKLDEIIAIVSDKVRNESVEMADGSSVTSYEHFRSLVATAAGTADIVTPVYDKEEIGGLINEICTHISANDVIYIDTTGGFRKTTNMLQLLTKILRYKGISNPVSYYANLQEKRIETTDEFILLTELADGVNEFVTTGRSDQLRRCLRSEDDKELSELLDSMQRFTDNILLCYVDNLEDDLQALKISLENFENSKSDTSETRVIVLRQLIPVIRDKFFGTDLSSETDYCRIVSWCLDNGLVQQALTVFTEKIAIELFRHNIISVDRSIYDETAASRSTMFSNIETELFYAKMMSSSGGVASENDKLLNNFARYLDEELCPPAIQIKPDRSADKMLADYKAFAFEMKKECSRSTVSSALKKLSASKSDKIRRIADIILKGYPNICNVRTFEGFTKSVKSNQTLQKMILGIEAIATDKNANAYSKKFSSAAEFEKSEKYCVTGFAHGRNVSNRQIAEIMYGYLYVKSTRNRINHASDNETLTDEQEEVLRKHNYRISKKIAYTDITQNIRHALGEIMTVL